MSVRSAQSVTVLFTTRVWATGVGTNADSLPTGTLYVNGTANAATVTVTNISTGLYKAQVTLPTLAATDEVEIAIAATVSSVSDTAVIWGDTVVDVIVDGVWDEVLTGATHNVPSSSGRRLRQIASFATVDSSVNDAAATTTSFVTALSNATDNFYNDQTIVFTSGTLSGQARLVSAYNGTTKAITTDEAFTSAPGNGDTFQLIANHVHPLTQVVTAIWQDTTAGDFTVPGSIGKYLFNMGSSATFTVSGFIDANIQYVNDVQVKGVGTAANPWNPV